MKTKALLLVCFLSLNIFAISGYSPYKVYQQTDTLTHANLDSNIIRGSSWSTKLVDTLDKQFIRFSDIDDSSFTQISIDTIDADTVNVTGGIEATRLASDSATIPIFKGNETHRGVVTFNDSGYFAGGLRGLRLYFPQAEIDSIVGALSISGILSLYPNAGNYNGKLTFSGWAPNANVDDNYIGYNCVSSGSAYPEKITSARSGWFVGQRTVNAAGTNGSASYNVNYWPVDTTAYFTHITFVGAKKASDASTVINTPTTVNGALTTTTLNTGNGDNELYPMNQAVRTTDDPTFDSVTVTDLKVLDDATIDDDLNVAGTITGNLTGNVTGIADTATILKGNDLLSVYDTGSFPCTLKTSDVTVQQIGSAYYNKVGNVVTISFPYLYGTSNSNTLLLYCALPYYPRQTFGGNNVTNEPGIVLDNSISISAKFKITDATPTYIEMDKIGGGTYTSSGNKGVMGGSIRYITEN